MLESELGTHTLVSCLENPPETSITVKSAKVTILKADFDALLSASINHPSAKHITTVATETSWCCLWDISPLSVVFKAQEGCNYFSRSLAEDLLMVSHADPVAVI